MLIAQPFATHRNQLAVIFCALGVLGSRASAQPAPPSTDFDQPIDYVAWLNQQTADPQYHIKRTNTSPPDDPFGKDNDARKAFREMLKAWLKDPARLVDSKKSDEYERLISFVEYYDANSSFTTYFALPKDRTPPLTLIEITLPLASCRVNSVKCLMMISFYEGEAAVDHLRRASDIIADLSKADSMLYVSSAQKLCQDYYRVLASAIEHDVIKPEEALSLIVHLEQRIRQAKDCLVHILVAEQAIHYSLLQRFVKGGMLWGYRYDQNAIDEFSSQIVWIGAESKRNRDFGFKGNPVNHAESARIFFETARQEMSNPYSFKTPAKLLILEGQFKKQCPLYAALPIRVDRIYQQAYDNAAKCRAYALRAILVARSKITGQPPSLALVPEELKSLSVDLLTNQPFRLELEGGDPVVSSPGVDLEWNTGDDIVVGPSESDTEKPQK